MPPVATIQTLTRDVYRWLLRPRVRLTVTGLMLLFIGAVFASSSVWTLPFVIAGALMVAIAWLGSRIEGHFTVEFGGDGTQFHCGARVKPHPALVPSSATPSLQSAAREPQPEPAAAAVAAAAVPDADVVEGTAHTVEIEVAELEALIAAAGTVSKS
jgi:hypothetical protein